MLFFEEGVRVELFRSNHRTAYPSLEVGTRQMTTSTLRVIISTTTEYNNEMKKKQQRYILNRQRKGNVDQEPNLNQSL